MAITNATDSGLTLPTGQSIQTATAVVGVVAGDTLATGEKFYSNMVTTGNSDTRPASNGSSTNGILLNGATDTLVITATPRGLWVAGTTYTDNDAVYTLADATATDEPTNRLWWIANTETRTVTEQPAAGVDGWDGSTVSHEGSIYLTQTGMGTNAWAGSLVSLGIAEDGGTLTAFNTTINLNGGFFTEGSSVVYNMDEVSIYNHNDEQIYWRQRHGTLPAASTVGHIILDGDEQGTFIYYPPHLGTAQPTALTAFNGGIIGHGGSSVAGITDTPILPNYDFTKNRSLRTGTDFKFHLGISSGTVGSNANLRTYEVRNSADGTDFGFSTRLSVVQDDQSSGGGQITSEGTFIVTDDALLPVNLEDANVYVASQNETSFTEGGQSVTLDTSFSTATALNDELTGDRLWRTDNNRLFTTNASGSTGQQLLHLAYYQIATGTAAEGTALANAIGNRLFMMHGNTPLTTVSKYGYVTLQFNPDLRGFGAKTYEFALPEDATIIGATAPTNVTDTFATNVLTSTLSANASLDDLRDAAHQLEVNVARTGSVVNYLTVAGLALTVGTDSTSFTIAGTGNIVNTGAEYTSIGSTTAWGAKNITDVTLSGGNHTGMGTTMVGVDSTGTGNYTWATGTSFNSCQLTSGTHTFNNPTGFVNSSVTQAISFGNSATVTGSTFTNEATLGTGSTVTGNTFNGTVTTTGDLGVFDNTFVTAGLVIDTAQDITNWVSLPSGITKASAPIVDVTLTSVQATALGFTIPEGGMQTVGNVRFVVPAIPPEDRTFTIPSTLAGEYIISTDGVIGTVQTKVAGSPLVIIDTDDEQNVDYKIWWNPTSSWSGNAADAPVIYDYSYAAWNPSTMPSSSGIADFQPDPSSAVTGAATTVNVATFTPVTGGTLSSGVAEFTITSAQTTYTAIQAQTLAWQIQNSELYLLAIATADFTAGERLIEFGSGDSTTYNSGGQLIRLNALGSQRILGASTGFESTALGPVMSVISADIILLSATLAQVAQASETQINAVGNELKANQEKLSTDVRLASQLRPASGTVPNTSS